MKPFFFLLCFLMCFVEGVAAEKQARLTYLPDIPVNLSSEINLEIDQSLPGLSFSLRGNQCLKAVLTLRGSQPEVPISHPPFDMIFHLESLKIALRLNDEKLSFDSEKDTSSLYSSQMSKMINRPVTLHFGNAFKLETGVQELMQAMPELPVLKDVQADALLMDLFTHLFSLGGVELKEGMVIEKQFAHAEFPALPDQVVYTITSIDDYNVYADLKGNIEKKSFSLSGKVEMDGQEAELVSVTLNGAMEGKAKWNRDNAMLYDLSMRYTYTATFKLGAWEWMMTIGVDVHNHTLYKEAA